MSAGFQRSRFRCVKRKGSALQRQRRALNLAVATVAAPLKKPRHPIEVAVETLVHAVIDVRVCSENYIPAARSAYKTELDDCRNRIDQLADKLNAQGEKSSAQDVHDLGHAVRRLKRVALSKSPRILQESLFVALFSTFDRFVGELMRAMFQSKGDLFKSIGREVKFNEMLASSSLEEVKLLVLSNEIETLRRQSYIEQFKWFETFFDLKLRDWKDWAAFVEASQRRNLFVHCDGVVSDQYLKVSESVGYKFEKRPDVGERLKLSDKYFERATNVVMDAAVMLAHTLWRKVIPDELEAADDSLNFLVYDFLHGGAWNDALRLGLFHIGQRNFSNDLNRRISIINLAIAYKFSGSREHSKLLARYDWSSSLPEFRLAHAVLDDDFAGAARIFRSIGKNGALLDEAACHQWPLFKEFRKSDEFLCAYEDIFEKPFREKVGQDAKEEVSDVAAAAAV